MLDYNNSLSSIDDLGMFRREEKTYICLLCSYKTEHSYTMRRHVLQIHSSHRPHKCNICGKSFGRKDHLSKHMKGRHATERPFSCGLCDKSFATSSAFQQHQRTPTHLMRTSAAEIITNEPIDPPTMDSLIKLEYSNAALGL